MANSYYQFTGWVSVSDILKSEPSCTSHKPRASFQRWQVRGDLQHGKCPHAATQSYKAFCLVFLYNLYFFLRGIAYDGDTRQQEQGNCFLFLVMEICLQFYPLEKDKL